MYSVRGPHPISGRVDTAKADLPQEDGTLPAEGPRSQTTLESVLPQASNLPVHMEGLGFASVSNHVKQSLKITFLRLCIYLCICTYAYMCMYIYYFLEITCVCIYI